MLEYHVKIKANLHESSGGVLTSATQARKTLTTSAWSHSRLVLTGPTWPTGTIGALRVSISLVSLPTMVVDLRRYVDWDCVCRYIILTLRTGQVHPGEAVSR